MALLGKKLNLLEIRKIVKKAELHTAIGCQLAKVVNSLRFHNLACKDTYIYTI